MEPITTSINDAAIDAFEAGPLSDRVSFDTGRLFAKWHDWSFPALPGLVLLHLTAIAFYALYKRANLIGPMISGRRAFSSDPGLSFAPLWRAVVVALIALAFAWWVSKGFRQ